MTDALNEPYSTSIRQKGYGCILQNKLWTCTKYAGGAPTGGGTSGSTTTSTPQTFSLTAKQFQFTPSTLTVKKGQPVKITILSQDVTHGFSIPEFNVNQQIPAGQTVTVEFTPDKTGSFTYFCSNFCGTGHGGMKGTLLVQEAAASTSGTSGTTTGSGSGTTTTGGSTATSTPTPTPIPTSSSTATVGSACTTDVNCQSISCATGQDKACLQSKCACV